jgi:putative flavoprotein involved in K+ transport
MEPVATMAASSPIIASRASRIESYDTIIVGGGQAGLAAGYHLAQRDADFVILDSAERVGDSWRHRWDSLRLFTPAAYSGLPGMGFPAAPMHLPDKDEVADYLERYAQRFDLPVRGDTRVDSLGWDGERYVLSSGRTIYQANSVIVATGPFQRPRVPSLASQLPRSIHQIHSSEYRNPLELPTGSVLVVGVGNSGAQIALELAASRQVWLSGRESGYLRRRVLGRDIYKWIWPVFTMFSADTRIGRRMRDRSRTTTDPLIGIQPSQLSTAGITRVGKLAEVRDGVPYCEGIPIDPDVVVWSTGFTPDYSWIRLPIFGDDGYPRHERGAALGAPGLYFLGLRFQHRRTSALIGGVGADAAYVADLISQSL